MLGSDQEFNHEEKESDPEQVDLKMLHEGAKIPICIAWIREQKKGTFISPREMAFKFKLPRRAYAIVNVLAGMGAILKLNIVCEKTGKPKKINGRGNLFLNENTGSFRKSLTHHQPTGIPQMRFPESMSAK